MSGGLWLRSPFESLRVSGKRRVPLADAGASLGAIRVRIGPNAGGAVV